MDSLTTFYNDFRDICLSLRDAKKFEEVELILVYSFAMCDYIGYPLKSVEMYYDTKFNCEPDGDICEENKNAVHALWAGFTNILRFGQIGFKTFKAETIRDIDGHILKIVLSKVKATFEISIASLDFDFESYYNEVIFSEKDRLNADFNRINTNAYY